MKRNRLAGFSEASRWIYDAPYTPAAEDILLGAHHSLRSRARTEEEEQEADTEQANEATLFTDGQGESNQTSRCPTSQSTAPTPPQQFVCGYCRLGTYNVIAEWLTDCIWHVDLTITR